MHAIHARLGEWDLMTHGALFLRYTSQNANHQDKRSDDEIDFPNWLMVMGGREFQGGVKRLDLRAMLSLDRWTEGGDGYPLLFATGETWKGQPLVDRQHPHDLFMELAALFTHTLSRDNQVFLYLGMPGEPALGPTAYMHRPSSRTNPDAVISHHNQDATHITFGVATVGWKNRLFKLDGSLFTGREPDEDRYDFDRPRFDSYSLRLEFVPHRTVVAQVSAGYLRGPEVLEPEEDLLRLTTSAVHVLAFGDGNSLASSLIFGGNSLPKGEFRNSFTLESEWDWNLGTTYGRFEAVQKSGGDLALPALGEETFWANGFTLGSSLRLLRRRNLQATMGLQGTLNFPGSGLQPHYGEVPASCGIFLRISPDILMEETEGEMHPAHGRQGSDDRHGH